METEVTQGPKSTLTLFVFDKQKAILCITAPPIAIKCIFILSKLNINSNSYIRGYIICQHEIVYNKYRIF